MKQGPQLRLFAASSLLVALLLGCAGLPTAPEVARDVSGVAAVPLDMLNPDVRQANVQETICVSGYTATVRPSTTYTNGVKAKLLRELGLPPADAAKYELDHRIPLAQGGHPRNPHNLALQLWHPEFDTYDTQVIDSYRTSIKTADYKKGLVRSVGVG